MQSFAVMLVLLHSLLRAVACAHGHFTAADAPAPIERPHVHLLSHGHDHSHGTSDHTHHHDRRHADHDRHDAGVGLSGSDPLSAATVCPSGHDCDVIFVTNENSLCSPVTRAQAMVGEAVASIAPLAAPALSMQRQSATARRVRPPGDPASPVLTLLPHLLRV